jgi:hypothetical protein
VLANICRRVDRDAEMIYIFDESQWRELILAGPPLTREITPDAEPEREEPVVPAR